MRVIGKGDKERLLPHHRRTQETIEWYLLIWPSRGQPTPICPEFLGEGMPSEMVRRCSPDHSSVLSGISTSIGRTGPGWRASRKDICRAPGSQTLRLDTLKGSTFDGSPV